MQEDETPSGGNKRIFQHSDMRPLIPVATYREQLLDRLGVRRIMFSNWALDIACLTATINGVEDLVLEYVGK